MWCAVGLLHHYGPGICIRGCPTRSTELSGNLGKSEAWVVDSKLSTSLLLMPAKSNSQTSFAYAFQVVACWGIGQFFSYAVIFSLNHRLDHWAYRIPFAVQWIWPAIISK